MIMVGHSETNISAALASKRKASTAGLDGSVQHTRSVKRRASKACQCCRARKVRCNVTEHGAPCTNCRLDEVECVVSESRRKKKWSKDDDLNTSTQSGVRSVAVTTTNATAPTKSLTSITINSPADNASNNSSTKHSPRVALDGLQLSATAAGSLSAHDGDVPRDEHVPHALYQAHGHRISLGYNSVPRRQSTSTASPALFLSRSSPVVDGSAFFPLTEASPAIPYFIKPLPPRIGPDEAAYLEKKGALSIPVGTLRDELLQSYIEYVHPYMPLLDLYEFVQIVDSGNGSLGRISLILFQAVMFAGSAFVDIRHLHAAGYLTRKQARKDFFQKTRLLYDFDYESDRVSLVQALLLLTYYYETPDDQKDTWHWMGVATSIAHTIGLHRNPENSSMDSRRIKLWKRIWWSTYMRDRLIALGMRRPTRIKAEDYDVPMLTIDDFEIVSIPESVTCVPTTCRVARDTVKQRALAVMCIQKAKLCLCISHVLSKQYCVLNNNQGMVSDRTTMMLLPKKLDTDTDEVKSCDDELQKWVDELPPDAQHVSSSGDSVIDLHRSLLHMVFYTTLSALHRPQVLPSANAPVAAASELLEISRRNVRRAAAAITSIATTLDRLDLVRYLPTTGVTVLLPAIIIHLLDIKAPDEATRRASLKGFCHCMQVMGKLRDNYAAADYSTAFLEAAIRKAGIHISAMPSGSNNTYKPEPIATVEDLVDAGRRMDLAQMGVNPSNVTVANRALTPPPDSKAADPNVTDDEVARRLEVFLASTPPDTDSSESMAVEDDNAAYSEHLALFGANAGISIPDFDQEDFDNLLNTDALCDGFSFETGQDWLKGIA